MNNECKEFKIKIGKMQYYPYHWHDHLVILKVLKGAIKVRRWSVDSCLSAGDFIIFNIGKIHQVEPISEENLVALIYIDKKVCQKHMPSFTSMVILCNSSYFEEKNKQSYAQLRLIIDNLIREYFKNKPLNIEEMDLYMVELFRLLYEKFDYVTCGKDFKKFTPKVACRYKQLYEEIALLEGPLSFRSLKSVSKDMGVSYSFLRKDIVDRFGIGYKWLIHNIAVDYSAKLLLETDEPITTISQLSGFSDPKYMIRYFKTYYKCTPSSFRKTYNKITHSNCVLEVEQSIAENVINN